MTNADFSHLKDLEVTNESTSDFTLHQITVNGKSPTLILAPASEANKPYFNALLKRSGKTRRQVGSGNINAGLVAENRGEDRELYPQYVVKNWKDMVDAKGKKLAFNREDCEEFIGKLPDWLFDNVRNHAGEPSNFIEMLDIEVGAKNSQSGSSSK